MALRLFLAPRGPGNSGGCDPKVSVIGAGERRRGPCTRFWAWVAWALIGSQSGQLSDPTKHGYLECLNMKSSPPVPSLPCSVVTGIEGKEPSFVQALGLSWGPAPPPV